MSSNSSHVSGLRERLPNPGSSPLLPPSQNQSDRDDLGHSPADGVNSKGSADNASLEQTRRDAAHTLAEYRAIILELELTRMRRSRTSFLSWMHIWERLYGRRTARMLAIPAFECYNLINRVFSAAASKLKGLLNQIGSVIMMLQTETDIARLLKNMERAMISVTERRRRLALTVVTTLRMKLDSTMSGLSDNFHVELRRALFALDADCNYHPGNAQVEAYEEYMTRRDTPYTFNVIQPYIRRYPPGRTLNYDFNPVTLSFTFRELV
jgi:hypothetical protein